MERLIFCEGVDDAKALRGILRLAFKLTTTRSKRFSESREAVSFGLSDGSTLDIVPAHSKAQATDRSLEEFLGTATPTPCPLVGLSFDPDEEAPERWDQRITSLLSTQASQVTHPSAHEWHFEQRILLAIPWSVSAPVFDSLEDTMNLERLAVHATKQVFPKLSPLVEKWLNELAEAQGSSARSWKEAALLWHAATVPKIPEASFFDKVFEQQHEVAAAAVSAFRTQPSWPALERLATLPVE